MAKISFIDDEQVYIVTDNNKFESYNKKALNFNAKVGDVVSVDVVNNKIIISKQKTKNFNTETKNKPKTSTQKYNNIEKPIFNEEPTKPVNKLIYCIFAILFGSLGVHNFFAGKSKQGILYLLFSWSAIPNILSIIDFIKALTKKAYENGNIYL